MAQNHHDSAGDIRSHLQSLLDAKEQQLQQAAALGQQLLAQQMELEVRIMQLVQELDVDKPDKQAMDKYRELADSLVAWDAENAQFASSAFGETSSPTPSTQVAQHPSEEPTEASANMSAASQSRRAKNAARRADDVEFAFEIGSGLLNEVRRLQALLAERDKEKVDLEASIESLHTTLKQQEQSAGWVSGFF
ncbi:hypothetical protein BT96DRAFT_679715 [Gymnopus androsaceus JB14]|uniref:Uncharacterized protein n=1 Tax=Gymnopus androsaceus JB14 TaxID=1447944 RepID=A0A6A4HR39_9AGAR|nr:hypothetical protein BT96DRAFT_679715 [Gymnopus androsaceus JB14]